MIRRFFTSTYAPITIFLLALVVRTVTALPIRQPGYMDAYYYYHIAENLYQGRGFVEDFIWNYLNRPEEVTHPSNLFWMPLTSILVYPFFAFLGPSYRAAQLPFILISSSLPPLVYWLSYRLYRKQRYALTAGLLTIFSGFYTPFWVAVDNFAPFALTGSLSLIMMRRALASDRPVYFALAGFLVGLSHLARADGLLFLLVMLILVGWDMLHSQFGIRKSQIATSLVLGGYLLVMGPWFVRNWQVTHPLASMRELPLNRGELIRPYSQLKQGACDDALAHADTLSEARVPLKACASASERVRQVSGGILPTGSSKAIFLRDYDDLFSYSQELSWSGYLTWGWGSILASKLRAAWHNLLVLAGSLQFYLFPLAGAGLWQLRHRPTYCPFFVYLLLLYLTMTLVFTFPGMRGSMLHSTTALLPFLLAAVPPGLDKVVALGARLRLTWDLAAAQRAFNVGIVILAILISAYLYGQSVFALSISRSLQPPWNQRFAFYKEVGDWLSLNAPDHGPAMVVNPPAYHYFTRQSAIAIPNDDLETLFTVAQRYGARFLVLQFDHPRPLREIYRREQTDPRLELRATFTDAWGRSVQLYEIISAEV